MHGLQNITYLYVWWSLWREELFFDQFWPLHFHGLINLSVRANSLTVRCFGGSFQINFRPPIPPPLLIFNLKKKLIFGPRRVIHLQTLSLRCTIPVGGVLLTFNLLNLRHAWKYSFQVLMQCLINKKHDSPFKKWLKLLIQLDVCPSNFLIKPDKRIFNPRKLHITNNLNLNF